jgi:hypothetical protein
MASILAIGLETWGTVITIWVGAVVGTALIAMVVIGVIHASRIRLRPQVVIPDVELDEDVPPGAAAGLSRQLRDTVRWALRQEVDDARRVEMKTLGEDIAARLVRLHGVTSLPHAGPGRAATDPEPEPPTVPELDREAKDSMSKLSAGLRAVAPKEAEGLAAALEFVIPAQRGWLVRASPTVRGTGADTRAGLRVEVARLGRAPDAVMTFWATSAALQAPPGDAERLAAIRELLHRLVRPASVWIAIRLVSGHLTQTHRRPHWPLARRSRERELTGLELQLSGQLLLYATRMQEEFVSDFAFDALDDLERAAELLRHYFRPHMTEANVRERLGWSYSKSGDDSRARHAFALAVEEYDKAEKLLTECAGAEAGKRETAIEIALRRTKCRLLSCDTDQVTTARHELLGHSQLKVVNPRLLYNAACLFAVAMACPDLSDTQRADCEPWAWHFLGLALALSPRGSITWSRAATDEELGALDMDTRLSFASEIEKECRSRSEVTDLDADRIVRAVMTALGLTDPGARAAV